LPACYLSHLACSTSCGQWFLRLPLLILLIVVLLDISAGLITESTKLFYCKRSP